MSTSPRNLIITGGARGIGLAVASIAVSRGIQVVVIDKSLGEEFNKLRSTTSQELLQGVEADLSDARSIPTVMQEAAGLLSTPIESVVLCAGIYPLSPSIDGDASIWDAVHNLNARGTFLAASAAARNMGEAGGSIVLLTSVAYARGDALEPSAAYAASKGALVSLTAQLAAEWGELGIRVNAVAPGVIDTALTTIVHNPEAYSAMLARLPLHRIGQPEEVARACLFLTSADASYITGAVLPVDGGYLIS